MKFRYHKRVKDNKIVQICITSDSQEGSYDIHYESNLQECEFSHIQNFEEIDIHEFRDLVKNYNLGVYCSKSVLGCSISK